MLQTAAHASALSLAAFFLLCLQAHLTPTLTPPFHALILSSAPGQIRALPIPRSLEPSVETWLRICELINAGLAGAILWRKTRRVGLKWAMGFFGLGLFVDLRMGESGWVHLGLMGVCGVGIWGS